VDSLCREILGIALPSALTVVADPIASLIDTTFIGHLGIHSFLSSLPTLLYNFTNIPS